MQKDIPLPRGIKLCSEHAVYVREDDALAISDLHLGYEAALQAEHVAIPRFQLEDMLERLEKLLARHNPELVLINGDMKHEFSKNKGQEWDEVEAILDVLDGREIIVVRGNHDNYLQTILARRGIQMEGYFRLPASGITFLHGHKNIPEPGFKVFSHEHPMLRFRDEVGAMVNLPCFLYSKANDVLVLPAFSPLASGTNVISPEASFLSPGLRNLNLSDARIYVIQDGVMDFGRVEDLREMRDDARFETIVRRRRM